MGFLSKFFSSKPTVRSLPSGSITVSRAGEILASTVSSSYPQPMLVEIGKEVVREFQDARQAQLSLSEISLHFGSLRITAREIQGGAVIFLTPRNQMATHPQLAKRS
jgi:hypothetical protein